MQARERTRKWRASGRCVPILTAVFAFWSAAHCTTNSALDRARGQSGSEVVSNGGTGGSAGGNGTDVPGGSVPACPCGGFPSSVYLEDTSRAAAMLRVTLLEHTPGTFESDAFPRCRTGASAELGCARVRMRVEDVLGVANVAFAAGDELDAGTDGSLPCPLGAASISVGDQALAYVYWLPPELPACEEREQCIDQCESEYDAQVMACQRGEGPCPDTTVADICERCIYDLDAGCPPRPALSAEDIATRGNVRWTLWEDELLFAANEHGELRVPANELSALSSADCHDRFGNWSDLPGAFPNGTP